jgi:hypothetical protein
MKTVERPRYKDKKIFQTRRLTFKPYTYSENNMCLVMGLIKRYLTPDLLTPKYRAENLTNPTYGHCYHSIQALYYLMNTDRLVPMSGKDYRDDYHWWLQDEEKVYDPTADQYYSVAKLPPYHQGKKSKWYGWGQRPHQRSLDLIVRVLGEENVMDTLETVPPSTEETIFTL